MSVTGIIQMFVHVYMGVNSKVHPEVTSQQQLVYQ